MAKPAKKKEVEKFLGNKLEMVRNPSGPHEGYSISRDLSIFLPGVLPINLQHGRSEVPAHIIRQICDFLGLTFPEFSDGKKCEIGSSVIYRTLLWKHMEVYYQHFKGNRSAYQKILEQYLSSAESALPVIMSIFGNEKLTRREMKVVDRINSQFDRLKIGEPGFSDALNGRLIRFGEELEQSFLRN